MTRIEELAYAAGLLDGEGCISTCVNSAGHMPSLRVSIQMAHAPVVMWMSARFGGRSRRSRAAKGTHREQYVWTLSSRQAGVFLEAVLPYLIVKRPQAERAIALRALSQEPGGRKVFGLRGSAPVPPDVLNEGHRFRAEISKLNRTGTV